MLASQPSTPTLSSVADHEPLSRYEQRKLDGECTRCGCALPEDRLEAGESMCHGCHERVKANKRRSAKRRRASWKRKRLCGQCGAKRRPGGKLCPVCTVRYGAVPSALVDRYVDQREEISAGWDERLEQSPDGKLRARRRFHGQAKRGRQSIEQLDQQDLSDAKQLLAEGEAGLAYYRSAEVQAMPRVQREDVRAEAVAKLIRARGWIAEAITRNSPKSRKAESTGEDE